MALNKKTKMKNGIELSYHRVSSILVEVNNRIELTVRSYLDEEARQFEKDFHDGKIEGEIDFFPYIHYEVYELPYDEKFDVKTAYQWLKKNEPNLSDSEDV